MFHFVYIIYSSTKGIYYKGYSKRPFFRLKQHNENLGCYTKYKGPWVIVYLQSFQEKKQALIRERKLKKYSKAQIKKLIQTPLNELEHLQSKK